MPFVQIARHYFSPYFLPTSDFFGLSPLELLHGVAVACIEMFYHVVCHALKACSTGGPQYVISGLGGGIPGFRGAVLLHTRNGMAFCDFVSLFFVLFVFAIHATERVERPGGCQGVGRKKSGVATDW